MQYVFSTKAKKFLKLTGEKVKMLVCNTMTYSCWANHNVKNGLLFFNSELKTSCKKGDTSNDSSNDFSWCLYIKQVCILVQFSTVLLENNSQSIEIISSPLRKSLPEKVILNLKKNGAQNFRWGVFCKSTSIASSGGEPPQFPQSTPTKGRPADGEKKMVNEIQGIK